MANSGAEAPISVGEVAEATLAKKLRAGYVSDDAGRLTAAAPSPVAASDPATPAAAASTVRPLRTLPKAELHIHFGGMMRFSTLEELCALKGIAVPNKPAGERMDFSEFHEIYRAGSETVTGPEHVRRIILEKAEDFRDEGTRWMEIQLDSASISKKINRPEMEIWELLHNTAQEVKAIYSVGIVYIAAAARFLPPAKAEALARISVEASKRFDTIVGFGLQGDEAHLPGPFDKAFQIAREGGLKSMPHAGEFGDSASVMGALMYLQADRIGHGIAAAKDDALMRYLAKRKICCEVCPSSNVLLQSQGVQGYEDHPLPRMMKAGVPCTLGTDDPMIFLRSILEEYQLCRDKMKLSDEELAELARNSFIYSLAPEDVKRAALADIDAWLGNGNGAAADAAQIESVPGSQPARIELA